jgi:hypothetical protein
LRFECLERGPLRHRLMQGGFTLEASLILAHWLQRAEDAAG